MIKYFKKLPTWRESKIKFVDENISIVEIDDKKFNYNFSNNQVKIIINFSETSNHTVISKIKWKKKFNNKIFLGLKINDDINNNVIQNKISNELKNYKIFNSTFPTKNVLINYILDIPEYKMNKITKKTLNDKNFLLKNNCSLDKKINNIKPAKDIKIEEVGF